MLINKQYNLSFYQNQTKKENQYKNTILVTTPNGNLVIKYLN